MPLRLPQRQADLLRVERLLRRGHHDGVNVLLLEQAAAVLLIPPADRCQRADQPLQLLRPVADGKVRQYVSDVAELNLDVVLVAQYVVHLDARKADVQCVHRQLGRVKVEHRVAVAQLSAERVVPADGVDLLARVLRHVRHLVEHLPPPQRQVAPRDVQAAHQQIAARRGLRQVDDLPHIARVYVGAGQQQGGLRQAPAALVHGHRRHVRARLHRRDGQPVAKVEVRAVRLVRKAQHPRRVRHVHDGPQVRADAVIGRVVHQHRHRLRVLADRLLDRLPRHAQRDAQPLIHLGVDVHGHRAAQHQRVDHAAVHVARQYDLVAALAGRQHHALHRAGRAAHHQKRVRCAEGLRRQLLRLANDRHRVAQVVQRLHAVDVHVQALLAQERGRLRVAPAVLVAGHVKGHHAHLPEALQRLVDGRAALIQTHLSHRILPLCQNMTKNADMRQAHTCVQTAFREKTGRPP